MSDPAIARQVRWLVITGALLVVAMAGLWFAAGRAARRQGPAASEDPPVIRVVGSFSVTNQAGATVTGESLRGRPWAVDLIFTRCPGPCAILSGVMAQVQERLPPDSRAGLLSITSDPDFDTPEVLARYAERFGADTSRWQFVTGTRDEIRRLATEELLLVLQEKSEEERESEHDLFLHSTLIVVLDAEGRLRAAVPGLEPGAVERITELLRRLEG